MLQRSSVRSCSLVDDLDFSIFMERQLYALETLYSAPTTNELASVGRSDSALLT